MLTQKFNENIILIQDDNDQNEQESIDLIDQKDKSKEDQKEGTLPRMVKLPNPFRKSKVINDDDGNIFGNFFQ